MVSVSQLAPYAVGVPRWVGLGVVGLGVVGVALLAVGVRDERRRRDVTTAVRWVRGLR